MLNKPVNDQTGYTLKKLRSEKGISIRELASLANTEASTISRIEAAEQRPSLLLVFRLCEALEISLVDFVRYLTGERLMIKEEALEYRPSVVLKEAPDLKPEQVQVLIDIANSMRNNLQP